MGGISNVFSAATPALIKGKGVGGILKGFKQTVFGGKDLGTLGADPIAADVFQTQKEALALQRKGLTALSTATELGEDPSKIVGGRVGREIGGLTGLAQDQIRQAREGIARRGLGATTLGQRAETGITRRLGGQVQQLQASIPERIQAIRLRRAQALLGGSGDVIRSQQVPIRFRDQPLGRSPGLIGGIGALAGGAFGGAAGGPQGALAGGQAGGLLGGAFSRGR